MLAALAFLTVGMSLKLALFPLHQWLPNAYTYAPSAVSAFLAATATKVAVYVLLRFYFTVFGDSQVLRRTCRWPQMMLLLALAGMFAASAIAIFQTDLKRLFAYSSVAQIGYIILGLSFDSRHRPHGHHRAPVQPRRDQGRDLHAAGLRRRCGGRHRR